MKSFIVFALFVAAAVAAPANPDGDAITSEFYNNNIGVDGYRFYYKTSNDIQQSEDGKLENPGTDNEALEVSGQYSYVIDGVTYTVTYTAGRAGFQPQGAHLPKAP